VLKEDILPSDPYAWIEASLNTIRRANWYRSVQSILGLPGAEVVMDGKVMLNFASNDYLGLAGDPRLQEAAIAAIRSYGTGSTGSRLLSGHRALHAQLEVAIARLKQTDDALVFSSGYLANLGTICALVGKRDLILSDRYNHSSLKSGAVASGAKVLEYAHCSMVDLQQQLQQHRANHRHCLILTDSVFSMDGDICPLPEILDIAADFGCMVLVDEAHATGVLGATGAGVVEHLGCTGKPLIQMGTLSKALGSLGGYVAGSASLIDFLRNRAPSWIYTTALSPADTAAALAAIQILQTEPQRRQRLWDNIYALRSSLALGNQQHTSSPLPSGLAPIPIVCFPLPNAVAALQLSETLYQAGIFAPAIRPPTVPTSRIRITVMATHQPAHLDHLIATMKAGMEDHG
jgi:8-amino-7-oxononanoate synthase